MVLWTNRALAVVAAMSMALSGAAPAVGSEPHIDPAETPTLEVVGGTRAAEGEYPWTVRLSMGCGGALLNDRVVLTAAHCVGSTGPDTSIKAEYGSVDLNSDDIREYRSTRIHTSPSYGSDATGDWALVLLEEPVANAVHLKLAETTEYDGGPFEIMGWGATSEGGPQQRHLIKADVPVIDDDTCADSYGDDLDPATMLCAGYSEGGIDSCQGDSGGPMIARTATGEAVQVGIVSWGHGCARSGFPGVYAQVSYLSGDIAAAAKQLVAHTT